MLKGIVFDLDGTLVDSLSVTFDAFNYGITQFGGRKHTPAEIMKYFGTGEDEIFVQIMGKEKAAQAYAACCKYTDENLAHVPLHSGVGDLLENLKSAGVPISIFTGRSWITTEMILKHHGLMDRFITVVANDHVDFPKPSPAGLHLALSKMKLNPNEVLFVGDSPADMIASRAAGSQGVAALWDLLAEKELLQPHEPHHWATHPMDIWKVWKH
jgi:phosphoglycolate phosphatase/pyrophosphatase PpaX